MTEPRSLDPSECWVRHIVRGAEGDLSAMPVGRVFFVRADVATADGLNSNQGWQAAQTTCVLSDDGSFTMTLANVAGDDGILHRRRFRFFTDEFYEPGEEYLEFYRDPNDLIFVGTVTGGEKNSSTVTVKGADLGVVLAGSSSSEVDAWDAAAPADVLRHYSRLKVLAFGEDLKGVEGEGEYTQALTGMAADCWIIEARLRWTSVRPTKAGEGSVKLKITTEPEGTEPLFLEVDAYEGAATLSGAPERPVTGKRTGLLVPSGIDLRFVAFYDHVFAFVAGELVAEFRQEAWAPPVQVGVSCSGGTVAIDGVQAETLVDFAGRGSASVIERKLPGVPPAAGLRGQYWNIAPLVAQYSTTAGRLARLWKLAGEDAAVDRVDPTVNFPTGVANYPPNLPGGYAARWSGAIYLDLAAADRNLKLIGNLVGNVRVYVGRTIRGEELLSSWGSESPPTVLTSSSLRTWLGTSVSGWYPIVIEQAHSEAVAGMILQDRAGTGSYAVVPQSRLSPIGCYSNLVRLTSHRQVFGEVAQTFGYQWRTEYRSLESGEFPGQLSAKALIGRQTDVVIDDDAVGSEAAVTSSADDVVDGFLADAAGMATPGGAGQLTAQVVDYDRAKDHLALRQVYESLSDISEERLFRTRINSLLALRSSPNEQVGVRPKGQRDLVDTFPLTGSLALMDWRPGDGVRLRLDSIDVKDDTPRQLTTVSWPLKRDGIGVPTVGFRQRPRTIKAALKKLSATIYGPRRTYQGGIAISTGSLGGQTSAGGAVSGSANAWSRAPLPTDLTRVVKATVVVQTIEGKGWRLEVNGVDLEEDGAVPLAGRYDVTRVLGSGAFASPYAYVRLIGGESGYYLVALEIHVTV